MADHHLAQLNVATMLAPLDSPVMAGFVAGLEPINALADRSPGFVWRLQTEDGDATSIRVFDDDMVIINLSVWEDVEHLRRFVYSGDHLEIFRRRTDWFSATDKDHLVLWWVESGHQPSVHEAAERLELLRRDGPTPEAFTFGRQFSPRARAEGENIV